MTNKNRSLKTISQTIMASSTTCLLPSIVANASLTLKTRQSRLISGLSRWSSACNSFKPKCLNRRSTCKLKRIIIPAMIVAIAIPSLTKIAAMTMLITLSLRQTSFSRLTPALALIVITLPATSAALTLVQTSLAMLKAKISRQS